MCIEKKKKKKTKKYGGGGVKRYGRTEEKDINRR